MFRIGLGRAQITPPWRTRLAGYVDRAGVSAGTHDHLWARVVILEHESAGWVLVVLDLMAISSSLLEKVRQRVHAITGVPLWCISVAATHTHSAPELDEDVEIFISDRVEKAAISAWENCVPGKVGIGFGLVTGLACNRQSREGYADQTVAVLRFDDLQGCPLCVLAHYAAHPTVLNQYNLYYSRDFPGVAVDYLESKLGSSVMAIFINGAAGDISTRYTRKNSTFSEVKRLGSLLGEKAAEIAASIRTEVPSQVLVTRSIVEIPRRQPMAKQELLRIKDETLCTLDSLQESGASSVELRELQSLVEGVKLVLKREAVKPTREGPVKAELQVIHIGIGGGFTIAAIPGELAALLGTKLKTKTGCDLVMGYTNGYIGYIVETEQQEFNYEVIVSELAQEAGEYIISEVNKLMKEIEECL
jgi:neutral ceramidase